MTKAFIIALITKAALQTEVPPRLLLAICKVESSYRVELVTHKDGHTISYGPCQVQLETALYMDKVYKHKYLATAERLHNNVYANAFYAGKYLKYQYKRYGQWNQAVTAYNKGSATTGNGVYWNKVLEAMNDAK